MFVLKTLFFICAVIYSNEAKFVDTIKKCSIKDFDCQANLFTSSNRAVAKTGISELGIPPLDPYKFKDITVSVLDLMDITAIEGTFTGGKDCVVEKHISYIEKGHAKMTLYCPHLTIKAKYKVSGSNPVLRSLFNGGSVNGEGDGKVKIEKMRFFIDYFYDLHKNKNGDIFFMCRYNETVYTYEVLGDISFDAGKIILGGTDATKVVLDFMNENSKFLMNISGRNFIDKAMESVNHYIHLFFSKVPAKYFVLEDMSQYVKN